MVGVSAVSPWVKETFTDYSYFAGTVINLFAAIIVLWKGRPFEKAWGIAFLFFAVHQALNLFPILSFFPYVGDVFYGGFYLMLFAGNLMHLWDSNSIFTLSTLIVLSILSVFASLILAFNVSPFNMQSPLGAFFNVFYVLFSFVNVLATVRPAMFDRAWVLRTLAFGIFFVTEVWFALWLYGNYTPPDASVTWFGVVMLAVLSQKPVKRRTRIVRF
jgi:hypothetical protein